MSILCPRIKNEPTEERLPSGAAVYRRCIERRGVVASDLPYFREVLETEPYSGILVPPGDAAAMADAIEHYLSIPLSIRKEAACRLVRRYEWSEAVLPVVNILRGWAEQVCCP